MSETTTEQSVARFLTQGDALVEITAHRFRTKLLYSNHSMGVDSEGRECVGFRWECKGCQATSATESGTSDSFSARNEYGRYLDGEYGYARQDANRHATECRAIPMDSPWAR